MEKITGDVQAALLDVMIETMVVLMRLAQGEFGPIEEDTSVALAAALGTGMADVQNKLEAGKYS